VKSFNLVPKFLFFFKSDPYCLGLFVLDLNFIFIMFQFLSFKREIEHQWKKKRGKRNDLIDHIPIIKS